MKYLFNEKLQMSSSCYSLAIPVCRPFGCQIALQGCMHCRFRSTQAHKLCKQRVSRTQPLQAAGFAHTSFACCVFRSANLRSIYIYKITVTSSPNLIFTKTTKLSIKQFSPFRMAQQAKVLAFFVLLMASESAMGSITCSSMIHDLNPCLPYLREVKDVPSAGCCNGARVVGSYFNSNTDRYAACECLQDTGATVNGIYVSRMRSLPQRCAVSINLPPISADGRLDCSWWR